MSKLVIVFPGLGYHADKPLLYYARKLAQKAGFDECLNLKFDFCKDGLCGNEEKIKECLDTIYTQAESQLENVKLDFCEEVLFVSKSIGTAASVYFAHRHCLDNAKQILFTPLHLTFSSSVQNGIVFFGTKDPWVDSSSLEKSVSQANLPYHVYEGLNHSLESGDVLKDMETLLDVMKKVQDFLDRK